MVHVDSASNWSSISTHTHTHTHTRVKQLVWLKLTHYTGCEFLVHRVLFALRKESVLREHVGSYLRRSSWPLFTLPQNICRFSLFFIKCCTTRRNDRAREQLISLAEQLKCWSTHRERERERDVVWQSSPNHSAQRKAHFTFGRRCSRRIRNVKMRRGDGRNGGGIIHQLRLIPSLPHSHVSYRTLRRSQYYQAQAQRRNQLFLFSL